MTQLSIIPHGDSAAVVLPIALLKSIGLEIGDSVDVTFTDRQLILRPIEDADRRRVMEEMTRDVFAERRDAYQRLA